MGGQAQDDEAGFADEWLEADGGGGFASGPVRGPRARRYHALLLTEDTTSGERFVLVNGVEAWVVRGADRIPLTTARYLPDVLYPDGYRHQTAFEATPWPCWTFDLGGGLTLRHEVLSARGGGGTVLRWRLQGGNARLEVRPMLTGRSYHALHRRNDTIDFTAHVAGQSVTWRPYAGVPGVRATANGRYQHAPDWFMNVLYAMERERGFEGVEDMASPGLFSWDFSEGEAVLVLQAERGEGLAGAADAKPMIADERARRQDRTSLDLAAAAYMAKSTLGPRLLAGFPWFADWGRDTFIAMRGLLIARARYDEATAILLAWAGRLSQGMLPNRLSGDDGVPEYNTVDAALWFVIAGHELVEAAARSGTPISRGDEQALRAAFEQVVACHAAGTRFGIGADADGLLRAGEPGTQLTWMDARVDGRSVTPRVGKPVEIQALWINALRIAGRGSRRWQEMETLARTSFLSRFADPSGPGLLDVVDVDHVAGAVDTRVRPNQIFAVGGLPFPLVDGARAAGIVALVEQTLLTPLGLRTLALGEAGYVGRYIGDVFARDHAYHQGTAWPWLLGPFVEAWLRVQGDTPANRAQGRRRFLDPLHHHLNEAGIGHVSEIADGDAPHTPRGCPFQAWSLGELVRIEAMLLNE